MPSKERQPWQCPRTPPSRTRWMVGGYATTLRVPSIVETDPWQARRWVWVGGSGGLLPVNRVGGVALRWTSITLSRDRIDMFYLFSLLK